MNVEDRKEMLRLKRALIRATKNVYFEKMRIVKCEPVFDISGLVLMRNIFLNTKYHYFCTSCI